MDFLKVLVFPSTVIEWDKLDYHLRNAPSIKVFKQNILKFIRLGPNKVYNVHNPIGLKLLTRLQRTHKFSHNFNDCLDQLCICGTNMNLRTISSSNAHPKDKPLWRKSVMLRFQLLIKMKITFVLLFGSDKLSDFKTICILSAAIEYILTTERFNVSL